MNWKLFFIIMFSASVYDCVYTLMRGHGLWFYFAALTLDSILALIAAKFLREDV